MTPPAQRVQFILGQESQDVEHESHPVFSEMEELYVGEDGNMEWKEAARWGRKNIRLFCNCPPPLALFSTKEPNRDF